MKGSNDAITLWSDRLRDAINIAKNQERNISSDIIFSNEIGIQITDSAFSSSWGRRMEEFVEAGGKRFTFHDLKAKGISDFEGDKQVAGGHKTNAMTARYDRKKKQIAATE